MSTPLPITHDCCWQPPGSACCPGPLAAIPRGAAAVWRRFARWQARKLAERIAAIEPDARWLP